MNDINKDNQFISTEENTDIQNITENKIPQRGMYKNLKVSVKVLNIGIVVGILALVLVTVFLAVKGNYKVEFNVNGGTAVETQALKYGKPVAAPKDPERTNYTFGGWYIDKDFTKPWVFEKDVVENNMILYAKWIPTE